MAKDDNQDLTEIKVVRKTVRKKEDPKKPPKQKPNEDKQRLSDLRDRQHTHQRAVIHNPDRFSFIKDEPKRARAIRWYRSYLEKRYMLTNKLSPIRFLPTALQIKWYRIDPQLRHRVLKGSLIAIVILLMGIGIREQTRQEAEERLEGQRQREQENKDRVDELQEELDRLEAEEIHRERQEELREEIKSQQEKMEDEEELSDNQLERDHQRRLDEIKRLREQERNEQERNEQESDADE